MLGTEAFILKNYPNTTEKALSTGSAVPDSSDFRLCRARSEKAHLTQTPVQLPAN